MYLLLSRGIYMERLLFLSDKNAIVGIEGLAKSSKHKLSKSKKKKTESKQQDSI